MGNLSVEGILSQAPSESVAQPRALVSEALSFALLASTLLAPLRVFESEYAKPTALVMIPAALGLLLMHRTLSAHFLVTRFGGGALTLGILMLCGYLLQRDVLPGGQDYRVLSLGAIPVLPIIFLAGVVAGFVTESGVGIAAGAFSALIGHSIALFVTPAALTFKGYDRASGILNDPNILALHLAPTLFLGLAFTRNRLRAALGPAFFLLVVWGVLQTLSRSGLVALLVGVAVASLGTLWVAFRCRQGWVALVGGLVVSVVIAAVAFRSAPGVFDARIEAYSQRIEERTAEGSLLSDRADIFRALLDSGPRLLHPLGAGYSAVIGVTDTLPHNTFIDLLLFGGPLAALLAIGAFLSVGFRCLGQARNPRSLELSIGAVLLLAFFVTQGLMLASLSVVTWKVNWLCFGLALGGLLRMYEPAEEGVCE